MRWESIIIKLQQQRDQQKVCGLWLFTPKHLEKLRKKKQEMMSNKMIMEMNKEPTTNVLGNAPHQQDPLGF